MCEDVDEHLAVRLQPSGDLIEKHLVVLHVFKHLLRRQMIEYAELQCWCFVAGVCGGGGGYVLLLLLLLLFVVLLLLLLRLLLLLCW